MAKAVINLQKESGGIVKISPVDGIGITEVTVPENGNLVSVDTSVTDNTIARYDGITGKLQDSGVIINDNGDLGVGVIPSGNYKAEAPNNYTGSFKFGWLCGGTSGSSYASVGYNFRTTATSSLYLYDRDDTSSMIRFDSGGFNFFTAPTGTIENTISYTQAMTLNNNGNLLLKSGTGGIGYGTGAGGTVTQLTSKSTAVTLNKPTGKITMHNESLASGATVAFTFNNNLLEIGDTVVITNTSWGAYSIRVGAVYSGTAVIYVTNTGGAQAQGVPIIFSIIKGSVS